MESVMPSNHLIFCHSLLFLCPIPPSIRVFSNESTLRIRWPECWNFSFSISPSNEHPGLISFRMDWLDLLAVQGTLPCYLPGAKLWWQRRQWWPIAVLLPGRSHGWRSLVGCSPWGREESGMTEQFHFHFSLSCIGEGNGNPLQCSCLENPRDGRAWWLPSVGSHRVGHDWSDLAAAANYGGGNEDNGNLPQKIPGMYCHSPYPQTLQQATTDPCLHRRLLDTHRQVSCGVSVPFFWVLVHNVLLCLPRVYFPVLCKFWHLYSGVNGELLQQDLCLTRTQSLSLQQTTADLYLQRRSSNTVLWGPGVLMCTRFVWALWAALAGTGFDSKCEFTPLTVLLGLLLCP